MAQPNSYNTSDLVANVQLITHIPLSNSTFNAPQIITLSDRELQTALISQILSVREGYYIKYLDYAAGTTGLYRIPSQAIGGAVSDIKLLMAPSLIPVNRIESAEQFSTQAATATSYGYYIESNTINILPVPPSNSVRVYFPRRPNKLVQTSAAGSITAINGAVITVASLPSTFLVDTRVDLCQDQPPFDVLGSRTITAINGLDVTLSSAVDDLAAFDWLCLENQTPVPQIPVEFRPILEQRVACTIYELQGYLDKLKAAREKLKQMEMDTFKLIAPRNQSQTPIINPQNGGFVNNAGQRSSIYWATNR